MWTLPVFVFAITFVLAIPLGLYMAYVFEGRCRIPGFLRWIESRVDTGPQYWKQYCWAFMLFNVVTFVVGFAVLATQPYHPSFLNPDGKGMLSPSTIFHTAISFMTNTNQQHYSGEVHFSYFTQIFFVCWKQILSPVIGLAALVAIIRGLRGDKTMGNFYLDMWRGVAYFYIPLNLIVGVLLLWGGSPMTLDGAAQAATVETGAMGTNDAGNANPQLIARGPVAAIVAVKQFGTNGGGYFGANSAHPFENPNSWTNLLTCMGIILIPVAQLVMFGKMLKNYPHAAVIFGVMLVLSLITLGWSLYWDAERPNPALTAHPAQTYHATDSTVEGGLREIDVSAVAGLPVDQSLGNLEGKELRFGTAAGATWAALTTNTSNGSVNCMHDSLNPLAGITPLTGMWLNCIWGGVGVGLINLLIYLIIGVFIAGLMVGRTPEYLGKKVEAKEMKLASFAMLAHPLLILIPAGLFVATDWGFGTKNNPAAHGFSEIVYEFTSASANNGSGFEGLGDTVGFAADDAPAKAPQRAWDIACGLVMLLGRFIPIIAPIAIAGSLSVKKATPFTVGTLRTDTVTFGFVLLGTILLVGALLFLPAAVLGPVAEHFGPLPFGG
ncbi:MAG TPA: potassium-transporting ATPase subunit KdpA [Pirellulales bacterium]|nr:potassium-transporting ATPase subunit KdpA [Pirellulales bacterium]